MVKASDNQSWVKCRIFGQLKHRQRIINPGHHQFLPESDDGLETCGFHAHGEAQVNVKATVKFMSFSAHSVGVSGSAGSAELGPSGDWLFPMAEKVELSPVR